MAGHPAYPGLRYLIELPDGTGAEIPISWAVPVTDGEVEGDTLPPAELWAGLVEFLALAHMVQVVSSLLPEEVACNEPEESNPSQSIAAGERLCDRREPADLGAGTAALPAGIGAGAGGAAAPSPGTAPVPGDGGARSEA